MRSEQQLRAASCNLRRQCSGIINWNVNGEIKLNRTEPESLRPGGEKRQRDKMMLQSVLARVRLRLHAFVRVSVCVCLWSLTLALLVPAEESHWAAGEAAAVLQAGRGGAGGAALCRRPGALPAGGVALCSREIGKRRFTRTCGQVEEQSCARTEDRGRSPAVSSPTRIHTHTRTPTHTAG